MSTLGTYAQDDDVYFVPSSKNKTTKTDTYVAPGQSSYTPIAPDNSTFEQSNWAQGRSNGKWDVDAYNRRGKNYQGAMADSMGVKKSYDQGYDDGYEDGSCTARIVRFWSPRVGVYVSSPYYLDFYDYAYDPFYYGYGSAWSIGWSGWYGWGSWYGWRPYYSSWYGYGWHGWYDPWYNYGWGWSHSPSWAWQPARPLPRNVERGPVGGWTARGGARGVGGFVSTNNNGRNSLGMTPSSTGRGFASGRGFSNSTNSNRGNSGSFNMGTRRNGNAGNNRRPFNNVRSFRETPSNSTPSNNSNRTFSQPSQPSRSSFGSGGGFSGSSRGGFGGGGRSGGRGFGGR